MCVCVCVCGCILLRVGRRGKSSKSNGTKSDIWLGRVCVCVCVDRAWNHSGTTVDSCLYLILIPKTIYGNQTAETEGERETEREKEREIKDTIEEGSNKGTHNEKMEDGDRETPALMRNKKRDWRLKGCGRKKKDMDVRETILQIYL